MPETAKMIIVLTLISGIASLGLAAINEKTIPLIAENERQFTLRSINRTMPEAQLPNPCQPGQPKFDNKPDQDVVCVNGYTVYRGRKAGDIVGLAVATIGERAYSGTIRCLVGLDLDGMITGVEVLAHAETPGLGAKIEDCDWRAQLVGKKAGDMVWKVVKDGGSVSQISGATISSRSMIDCVLKAQKLVTDEKEKILTAQPMGNGEVCHAR
jgi:electron transport complex protein RnfG